jgi:glucuronoarabinoxylan endo-1,4-beta-xylanase
MRVVLIFCFVGISWAGLGQSTISIDVSKKYQTIKGFGAFGGVKAYWETPPFYTDTFIQNFLSDLGSTIVRTNIPWDFEPANDNASPYVTDLTKFNYKAGSSLAGQLTYYKALKAAGLKKLIATSWTPPVWMKLLDQSDRIPKECYNCNNCPIGDPARAVCGGRLNPDDYAEFAEYLLTFVKVLKAEADVDLYAINIQNEPYFANPFEANVVRPDEFAKIIKIVGDRFRQEGITTKLFGPEHMAEWSWGVQTDYVNKILADPEVNPYLDIYAVHGYVDGVAPDFGSADGWTALYTNISKAYKKPLWMTETSGYAQTSDGGMDLAKSIYLALRFGNVSGWVFWSVSDDAAGTSFMIKGVPTGLYYAAKQYFKYIRPEAIRVDAQSDDHEVLPLTFINPTTGTMTIIAINTGSATKQIQLNMVAGPTSFNTFRTSASENSVAVETISNTVGLPPMSITTLVGQGPAAPSIDDIPDYYIPAGKDTTWRIPLAGIGDGNGGQVNISINSTDPSMATSTLEYSYPDHSGTLVVKPNTSNPGKTTITLNLTNQNVVSSNTFGFNSTSTSFNVQVVDKIAGLKKSEVGKVSVYPNPVDHHVLVIESDDEIDSDDIDIVNARGEGMNINGSLVALGKITVNTTGWAPGLYIVRIRTKGIQHVKKILLQ